MNHLLHFCKEGNKEDNKEDEKQENNKENREVVSHCSANQYHSSCHCASIYNVMSILSVWLMLFILPAYHLVHTTKVNQFLCLEHGEVVPLLQS